MKIVATLFYLCIFICVLSCKKQTESYTDSSDLTLQKFYYPDGKLKKIQGVLNDTIEHGISLFYYPNGQLKDSGQVVNNVTRFVFSWDEDGGNATFNGCKYDGDVAFTASFDRNGKVTNYIGYPIYDNYAYTYRNSDSKYMRYLVPNLRNHTSILKITKWMDGKENEKSDSILMPDSLCEVVYKYKRAIGDFNLLSVLTVTDLQGSIVIQDSLLLKIDKLGNVLPQ